MSIYDIFEEDSESTQHLMRGMTLAEVTNTEDPDSLGRVKVKFLLRDLAENESCWARVMVPFAGSAMGSYWIPAVGDEVIVAFLGGEMDKPIIMGSVWSKTKKPPVDNEKGKNDTKLIKTKSGHTLKFFDESGKESILIESAKGQKITIDDKENTIELCGKDGKNKVLIDSSGSSVSISSATKIELKVGQSSLSLSTDKIALKATSIEIKSSTGLKLEAGTTLDLKSSAAATLDGGGMLTLKGSMTKIN